MTFFDALPWATVYLASEWIVRLVMLVVVPFRRSPDAAKGWLLFVFFLPWPALVLYTLIGRPSYPEWRIRRFARLPVVFKAVNERLAEVTDEQKPELPSNLKQGATLIQNLGRFASVSGNKAELLSDYDDTIDRLAQDIDGSSLHVHLLFYIFADDETGQKIIRALARAVSRGVPCRVLIDALGSRPWAKQTVAALEAVGVDVRLVLPLVAFGVLRGKSARADLRNHRKIAVIDGRIGYVGSQNLVNRDFKPGIVNQELVVRTTGPVVLQLQGVFVTDWFLETEQVLDDPAICPAPDQCGQTIAQVLPSGPDHPGAGVERLIEALIYGARRRVVITTPYFIPSEALLHALETAVLRGVDVHLVLSKPVDQVLVNLAQRSYYGSLLAAGVKVHLYRDKLLHAKHVSVDEDICLIGSSNIDLRSFILNSEISLIMFDKDVTRRLHEEQERYFAASDILDSETWGRRSPVSKTIENIARLMSPLL